MVAWLHSNCYYTHTNRQTEAQTDRQTKEQRDDL